MKKKNVRRMLCMFSLIALSSFWTSAFAQDSSPIEARKGKREEGREPKVSIPETNTPQALPFSQNWTNIGLITANDDWASVPGVVGFLGNYDAAAPTNVDPRTLLTPFVINDVDVVANQVNPDTVANGGVAEFDAIANPTIALNGSGTADAPHAVFYLNTTGFTNVQFACNIRDLDGSVDNSVQQVDVQYRVGGAGDYTSVAGGYIADATTGPSIATLVTPLNLTLPANASNQAQVEVRVISTNAGGNDEWVGIDDVNVTGTTVGGPAPTSKIFETYLNGANEVGGVATNGLGYGRVILNEAETQITASFYWENLTSGTLAGHIHQGAVGVNGGIIFDMAPTQGLTSGSTIDRVFPITPAQVATLRAGNYYFNIHTTNFSGGEIRGQLRVADATVDFEGDGRSDFAVMRDTNGNAPGGNTQWHINLNASMNFYMQEWGNGFALTFFEGSEGVTFVGDAPTPADFDGDGKADIAVWRNEALGNFYILHSSNNTIRVDQLGILNDIPTIVGDYNGDGKADPAVYRRSAGPSTWYYRPSPSSNFVAINLGNTTDIPAPGDYDGDGKADPAVFASGAFNILFSSGGAANVPFGAAGDLPVPGDFDGDGKTDLAVLRNASGFWQWTFDPSGTAGVTTVIDTWGVFTTDIPVRGDYTGDGKADYAVWRPGAQAEFFVMTPVTRQISSRPWGLAGDIPPAAAVGF